MSVYRISSISLALVAIGVMCALVACGTSDRNQPSSTENPVVPILTQTAVALEGMIGNAEVNRAATNAAIPSLTIIDVVDSLDPDLPTIAVWRTANGALRVLYPPDWSIAMRDSGDTLALATTDSAAANLNSFIAGEAVRLNGVALQIEMMDPIDGAETALAIAEPLYDDLANSNQNSASELTSSQIGGFDAATFTVTRGGQSLRYYFLANGDYRVAVMAAGDDVATIEAIVAALQIAPTPLPATD